MSLLDDLKRAGKQAKQIFGYAQDEEIVQFFIDIAKTVGISKEGGYNFGSSISALIESSRFLDFLEFFLEESDKNTDATLSKFMNFLNNTDKEKYQSLNQYGYQGKTQDIIDDVFNMQYYSGGIISQDTFNQIWGQDTLHQVFLEKYKKLYDENLKNMKNAYSKNVKYEQELDRKLKNLGIEKSGPRYYSFFELDKTGEQLLDAVSVSSKFMEIIIKNTEFARMTIDPLIKREDLDSKLQGTDQKYRLSLGRNSATMIGDIYAAARGLIGTDILLENGEKLHITEEYISGQIFSGIKREHIIDKQTGKKELIPVQLEDLQSDYFTLIQARKQGRILKQTGADVDIKRLPEIIFNEEALMALSPKNSSGFQQNADTVSVLTGLDVSFANGGGVSVKSYGFKSNAIQLSGHSLITNAEKYLVNGFLPDALRGIVNNYKREASDTILTKEALEAKKEYYKTYKDFFTSDQNSFINSLNIETFMDENIQSLIKSGQLFKHFSSLGFSKDRIINMKYDSSLRYLAQLQATEDKKALLYAINSFEESEEYSDAIDQLQSYLDSLSI